jgi:hypothetical protein
MAAKVAAPPSMTSRLRNLGMIISATALDSAMPTIGGKHPAGGLN